MNYLIFQSYGNTDILNECRYAILSLLKHGFNVKEIKIVIYTDRKDYFSFLPVQYISFVELSQDDIVDYKGSHAFVHRLKIKIIQDAVSRFEGKILYADSDIYFLKSIEPLFDMINESTYIMCTNEGAMNTKGNRVFDKFSKFITSNQTYLAEHQIKIPHDVVMWNAGIIGLQSSDKDKVDQALHICDIILGRFSSHVIEQLSFSYVLQNSGKIRAATDVVFHYWNLKEFRTVLAEFFDYHESAGSLETMIADVDTIRPDILIKPKMAYESLSLIPKAIRKMKGKVNRWAFPVYKIGDGK